MFTVELQKLLKKHVKIVLPCVKNMLVSQCEILIWSVTNNEHGPVQKAKVLCEYKLHTLSKINSGVESVV